MIARLRAVVEQVERLTEEERLVALWQEQPEQAQWEAKLADPRSQLVLDALVARAKEQMARGEVYDLLQ